MDEKQLKLMFVASLGGFFALVAVIAWRRPIAALEEHDFYLQLVTKTFETSAMILAVYVCWLLYSYLRESRFGQITLLIYFATVFIALDAVCTISERTVLEYAGVNTVYAMLKAGKHYFALLKGVFVLMAFVELYRFVRMPKAVATLLHAYEKAQSRAGEGAAGEGGDEWR